MRPTLLLLLGVLLALPAQADSFSFGLFGDTPYTQWERLHLPDLIADMDRENLAFVIHDGDIKSGSDECSDKAFADIHGVFANSVHPLIYVPGDNEWTDCHRRSNGGYQPLERLVGHVPFELVQRVLDALGRVLVQVGVEAIVKSAAVDSIGEGLADGAIESGAFEAEVGPDEDADHRAIRRPEHVAAPGGSGNEPARLEALEGLLGSHIADLELPRQLAGGRQPLHGGQGAGFDQARQVLLDLLPARFGADQGTLGDG